MKKMNLFEIDKNIERALDNIQVDPETGEVTGTEELEALTMEKEKKINNTAMYYLSLLSEADAYGTQKKKFAEWETRLRKKAERLKAYISESLNGEKFNSDTIRISYYKSEAVETDENFLPWAEKFAPQFLTTKAPEANKLAIRRAIKEGQTVEGAQLVEKSNIQIR